MRHPYMPLSQRLLNVIVQEGRALEFSTSLTLALICLTFALPGSTVQGIRALKVAADLGLTDAMLAGLSGVIAGYRATILIINGSWRQTPQLRKVGAAISAPIFASFACMMALPYVTGAQQAPGLAPALLIVAALCDIVAVYRSSAEVTAHREAADASAHRLTATANAHR